MAVRVASLAALIAAAFVYVAVAPFTCDTNGSCHGYVAFDYTAESSGGHLQAIAAAVFVGAIAGSLTWLFITPHRSSRVVRVIATPLLLAGIVVSLGSQSVLILIGPVIGGLVLYRMWTKRGSGHSLDVSASSKEQAGSPVKRRS